MRIYLLIPALILLVSSPAIAAETASQPYPPQQFASNDMPVPQAVIGYQSPTNRNAPIIMPNRIAQPQASQPGTGISPVMNDLRWLNF